MKKILISLFICVLVVLSITPVHADITINGDQISLGNPSSSSSSSSPEAKAKDVGNGIITLANYFVGIAGGIGIIGLVISAARFATATGNPRKLEEAKQGILTCVIGLALLGAVNLIVHLAFGLFKV